MGITIGNQTNFGFFHDSLNSLNSVKAIWKKILMKLNMGKIRMFLSMSNSKQTTFADNFKPPSHLESDNYLKLSFQRVYEKRNVKM